MHSVRAVLRYGEAHCIEGALVAACALWMQGSRPLLIHFDCAATDYPHVAALFRRGGHWGAISKSNHAALRYRDPVYRSLRELAMSYFHEYVDRHGRKTLRSYSSAFDLRRIDGRGLDHLPDIMLEAARPAGRRAPFSVADSRANARPGRPRSVRQAGCGARTISTHHQALGERWDVSRTLRRRRRYRMRPNQSIDSRAAMIAQSAAAAAKSAVISVCFCSSTSRELSVS